MSLHHATGVGHQGDARITLANIEAGLSDHKMDSERFLCGPVTLKDPASPPGISRIGMIKGNQSFVLLLSS